MFSFRYCLLLFGIASALIGGAADPPPRPPASGKPEQASKDPDLTPLVGPPLREMKAPPGSVFVIVNQLRDALDRVPGAVVLSPKAYDRLLTELEHLRRRLDPGRPLAPTSCVLRGQLGRDVVSFTAEFAFRTDRPNALVALGCQPGAATAARLDDRLPVLLPPGDLGYVIQVESPGEHHATLDFRLPLPTAGSERRLEFGLPRAAITTLELELPAAVQRVRLGGQNRPRPADNRYSLGAADRVQLTWDEPVPGPGGPPLLEADAQVTVRVDEVFVTTEAELTLRVRRGRVNRWRLLVPTQAAVELDPRTPGGREVEIDPPGKGPLRTVRLKEPSAEPLLLRVQVRQPRGAKRIPIGPFAVPDAVRQWGNIVVIAPSDVRLVYHRQGDVSQRELSAEARPEPNTRAAFSYWNVPAAANPSQLPPAPLELEIEGLRGAVEARVAHTVRLTEPGQPLSVVTRLDITPFRSRVDRIDVLLPPGYRYDASSGPSAQLVERVVADAGSGVAEVYLAEARDQAFSIQLASQVPLPSAAQKVALELPRLLRALDRSGATPRPVPILDRGGQLTVHAPDWLELTVHGPDLVAPTSNSRSSTWTAERAPVHADLAWRPHPVESVADVFLTEHRARVRQSLRLHLPEGSSGRLLLDLPPAVARRLRAGARGEAGITAEGGRLVEPEPGSGLTWSVALDPASGPERLLKLDYGVDLRPETAPGAGRAAPGMRLAEVPLVWPALVGAAETRVRLWCDEGFQPSLAGPGWEQSAWTEAAPDADSIPALVLRSHQKRPLTLLLRESPAVTLVVDRALFRVTVGEEGGQTGRAEYRLSRLLTGTLPVEWPAPPAGLDVHVTFDGKPVRWTEAGLDLEPYVFAGQPSRLHQPRVLSIAYQLPGARAAGGWNVQTSIVPPLLKGNVLYHQVRWQVSLPPGWVPLSHGGGHFAEQKWAWRGRLLAPRPAVSAADLAQWFGGPATEADSPGEPSLVCWQVTPEVLRITHLPTQVWLLLCSLAFIVLGLVLFWAPLPRALFWSLLVLLGLACALGSILQPQLVSAVAFGCEPGLVVLALVLGVQWLLQRRYRRQVVFMPGFTRLKQGSSLIRGGSSNRPREPSTIDAPTAEKEGAPSSELRP